MAAPKYNASIETRYWFEDYAPRAWPAGYDTFSGENNPKANYALDVNIDGQVMTFIPNSVIQNGVYNPFSDARVSGKSYTLPWFLDTNNQEKLNEVGKKIDLSNSDVGKYLKDRMGASTDGVLVPKGSIPFDSQIVNAPGKITGIGNIQGQNVYLNEDTNNQGRTFFIDPEGTRREFIQGGGGGGGFFDDFFGGLSDIGAGVEDFVSDTYMDVRDPLQAAAVVAGNYFVPGSSLITSKLVSDEAQEMLNTDVGKVANIAAGVSGGVNGNSIFSGTDPNATLAPVVDAGGPVEYLPSAVDASANVAPELLGEAGGNTFPLDLPPEGLEPIPLGDAAIPTVSDITNEIAGPELLGEAGGNTFPLEPSQEGLIPLGDAAGATAAEIAAAKVEMAAKGLTFKDALNYVRAGLLVNALTGDPLGLSGDTGGGGGGVSGGFTGFEQVPIPAEWRSPTYAASSAPIDLNTLFTNMNLLGGTQWQGLPTQKPNISFNDIFAAGQQQTPMGTPVDINQIVSSILGQNTASQKSA
jgi:hypothetical protein